MLSMSSFADMSRGSKSNPKADHASNGHHRHNKVNSATKSNDNSCNSKSPAAFKHTNDGCANKQTSHNFSLARHTGGHNHVKASSLLPVDAEHHNIKGNKLSSSQHQFLDTNGRLQRHRRASSDCCLHQIDEFQKTKELCCKPLDHRLFLNTGTSTSAGSGGMMTSLSRPTTPVSSYSRPSSPLLSAILALDPRRSVSQNFLSGSSSPHSQSRPVTPVMGSSPSFPLSNPHFSHLHYATEDRSSSRASIPEILVSDDFGSPSTSTGSSPLSGEGYLAGYNGDVYRYTILC